MREAPGGFYGSTGVPTPLREAPRERLDLRIGIELRDLLLEDEIGAHAAGREVPDPLLIFRAVRVAVEVPHAGPLRVLEQLDEEERGLRILAAEAMVLIVAAGLLRVEIDVEELPRLERLRDTVRELEAGHGIVRDLGIQADHLRMIERIDDRQRVADRRE